MPTDRNKPKPGCKHLNIINVPIDDLAALHHAAIDAGTNRADFLRALIHDEAERQRGRAQAGPAAGYKLEITVTGPAATADYMARLQANMIELVESWGGTMGGGYHLVDDNGNPIH